MVRSLREERIGLLNKNTYGSLMEIIEYNSNIDILVKFEKGKPMRVRWNKFCDGQVKYVYDRSVFGIGYLGEGKYKVKENGKITSVYYIWHGIIERCYSENYHKKHPTYLDCTVCEEWQDFQNFAKWYDENYYEIEGQRMCLDKDILIKHNKIYSPETCIFVPDNINKLFTKREKHRGELPIGVSFDKKWGKYTARCNDGDGKMIFINSFDDPVEAFYAYKDFKEKLIRQIAEEYKNKIPNNLYEALNNYSVEITD